MVLGMVVAGGKETDTTLYTLVLYMVVAKYMYIIKNTYDIIIEKVSHYFKVKCEKIKKEKKLF